MKDYITLAEGEMYTHTYTYTYTHADIHTHIQGDRQSARERDRGRRQTDSASLMGERCASHARTPHGSHLIHEHVVE